MLDDNPNDTADNAAGNTADNTEGDPTSGSPAAEPSGRPVVKRTTRKAAPRKTTTPRTRAAADGTRGAADGASSTAGSADEAAPAEGDAEARTPAAPTVKKTTRSRSTATKKAVAAKAETVQDTLPEQGEDATVADPETIESTDGSPTTGGTRTRKAAAKKTAAKRPAAKRTTRKSLSVEASAVTSPETAPDVPAQAPEQPAEPAAPAAAAVPLFQAPQPVTRRTRTTRKVAASAPSAAAGDDATLTADATVDAETQDALAQDLGVDATESRAEPVRKSAARKRPTKKAVTSPEVADESILDDARDAQTEPDIDSSDDQDGVNEDSAEDSGSARRRRRRGGRRRRKPGEGAAADNVDESEGDSDDDESGKSTDSGASDADQGEQGDGSSRRRRRRRRTGDDGGSDEGEDDANTVTRVRSRRSSEDQITALAGSTRLEAKKQRRREGREAGRRRAPIVSEAEFLARRESVDRVMVIRQRKELTQIAVLEDKVLVEHYVARESQTSLIGNVYLGRVQNVLPSMEAAFIDIGKGRNAVLYAGEVNWAALGHKDGQNRKIESVLSSGQPVLVQVTKDPVGHKGARLTSQISLAGRFLVYVPDGTTSGISRKLPDTERNRLKTLLKEIVPDTAGVIVRTAAEGASEDELTRDVERLKARWEDIEAKAKGNAPQLLYGEPDLTLKVVRDLFTEDFTKLVIEGDDAWDTVQGYVAHVAPDLQDRVERFEPVAGGRGNGKDLFATYRIEEQIQKGLDRKVWLPSGGSLIIDRTEAMTVVDVNTGKFTGSGGNLEETVTKNNLEAAEEIVRQLRLRDIGGIIVVDFIDMVLESNRDLVVRRLVECLGRDRTRHQVAEVTSLGLVQMTRKRIGTGLLEAFSTDCEHCQGRGVVIVSEPVEPKGDGDDDDRRSGARRNRSRRGDAQDNEARSSRGPQVGTGGAPSPKDVAAMPRSERPETPETLGSTESTQSGEDGTGVDRTADVPDVPDVSEAGTAVTAEPVRVQTRSRGRARAVVQPPEQISTDEPAEPAAARPAEPEQGPASEPDLEREAQSARVVTPEPKKPRVVTRTRGRSATRPAGPPVTPPVGASEPASENGVVGSETVALEPGNETDGHPGEAPHVEHVPIKKKGTRKR